LNNKYLLISLEKPERVLEIAPFFVEKGWDILASSETISVLKTADIPCEDISDFVAFKDEYGFPPTLHPKVEYALTNEACAKRIEIVFDIPYPLDRGNDVGGHTLLALAIKGNRIPITNYDDMFELIDQIRKTNNVSDVLRKQLQETALIKIIDHNARLLSNISNNVSFHGMKRVEKLLEGENPYQVPAYLCRDMNIVTFGYSITEFERVSGETACYTNLADMENLVNTLFKISKAFDYYYNKVPHIAILAKHGNPCGLSADWVSPKNAIENALWGSPAAIWGGEFVSNFIITEKLSRLLYKSEKRQKLTGNSKWMLDVIVCPDIDKEALQILGERQRTKLYVNDKFHQAELAPYFDIIKFINGGYLTQPANAYILDFSKLKWTKMFRKSSVDSYIIAWAVAYSSFHGGNEIAIAKNNSLLAAGGGPSTVEAAKIAVWRANENNHDINGSVFCADAFFPFTDAPEVLKNAGCIGGVVPSGGANRREVESFFSGRDMEVGFIPEKYRGFCRH